MSISIFLLLPILGAAIGALIGDRACKKYQNKKNKSSETGK